MSYRRHSLGSVLLLYSHYTNISRNIIKHNIRTSMNERTNTLLYKNKSLTLYSRKGDVYCVWEMSWRQGQTAILTQVLLATLAAFLSSLGWSCSTVGDWELKALYLPLALTLGILSPTNSNRLGTWLYYCLTFTCFRCSSVYLHRCISWLTARSRVNK